MTLNPRVLTVFFLLGTVFVPRWSWAQTPTPEQRRQAGAAFDQALAARAAGDHPAAARLFETADRLAPAPNALGNAIRSHQAVGRPGNDARAATLSLRMLSRYPSEQRYSEFANTVVRELSGVLARVRVSCGQCELEVDQRLTDDREFFLEPGPHSVVAHWSNSRVRTQELQARAGASEQVSLEAPAETSTQTITDPTGNRHTDVERPPPVNTNDPPPLNTNVVRTPPSARAVIPMPATLVVGGAALISGGVLLWSGVDALAGVPDYERDPTEQRLRDGQGRELRTNILAGTTAALGVAAGVMAIFTRWNTAPAVEVTPTVSGPTGASLGLSARGSF